MAAYIDEAEIRSASLGLQLSDISSEGLTGYIQRASSWVEQFTGRKFEPGTSLTEYLYTSNSGRARIAGGGAVYLYPIKRFPINAVNSLTWKLRIPKGLTTSSLSVSSQTISSDDIIIEDDEWGDGYRIVVFKDFTAYRDPRTVVEFTLNYDGGYSTYPDWLVEGTLQKTAELIKKRGTQALAMSGTGMVIDTSSLGGHLETAKEALWPHRRTF